MDGIATKMVQEKKSAVLAELQGISTSPFTVNHAGDMDNASEVRVRLWQSIPPSERPIIQQSRTMFGRDIISLLLKANLDVGLDDDRRLTDEEVQAQIPTFLVAGKSLQ